MKGVTLPDPFAAEFGLTEWAKRRAIKQLEHIGLVRVNRHIKGRQWLLSLVELSEMSASEGQTRAVALALPPHLHRRVCHCASAVKCAGHSRMSSPIFWPPAYSAIRAMLEAARGLPDLLKAR